jgi:hypothetical protein
VRNPLLAIVLFAGLAAAQSPDLEAKMRVAEAAWNRGDLDAFVVDYDDSPDTTFIGRTVTRGTRNAILDRYRRGYPTRAAMGTLTYSTMTVRPIDDGLAIMAKRTSGGWRIIHDHSSQ